MHKYLVVGLLAVGCGLSDGVALDEPRAPESSVEGAFSSPTATLLDFTFTAKFTTASPLSTSWARSQIDEQMLFTIGHLNGDRSVGRLDKAQYGSIRSTRQTDGRYAHSYTVKLPVSWGSKTNLPTTYTFTLPANVDYEGIEAFTAKYKATCVDRSAHDVDSGSIWYYYRPRASGCTLASADVVTVTATVAPSTLNTSGKYPEYHKVWEDGALKVVAIFGKYEDGATAASDAGIAAYNAFVKALKTLFPGATVTTSPASIPTSPGVAMPDVQFNATLPNGKKVQVNVLLVDNVRTAGPSFDARYAELSTSADLIAYNGHAGLGDNVRALARKGRFVANQYLIVFMNGCDTFAYVDGTLAETRAKLNPGDATGTKYMEFLTNAMPAFFQSVSPATLSVIKGLMSTSTPMTYDQILTSIDKSQVVAVTGEEDNVFVPGMGGIGGTDVTPPPTGEIVKGEGSVARNEEKRFSTALLEPGKYVVTLTGTGDADLYVRAGTAPTTTSWDCRPYQSGSKETCTVTLSSKASLFVMVRGYAATSTFTVSGRAL